MENLIQLNEFNHLVRARHGLFLANRYDTYLGYALIRYGEYGEIEEQFLSSLVKPGDVVVEVGANIGTHTIPLAKRIGENGKLIAIEAQPAIMHYLCANIALNGLFNVTTHGCGCGASYETMSIPKVDYGASTMQNFGGISLGKQDKNGVSIKVIPLDDLVADLPKVDLLKLDVEGMEGEVIQGAIKTINRCRPWMYIENDRLEKSQALIEQIMELDYRLWWHIPPLFNANNFFGVKENDYGNVASFNMLCLPREDNTQVDNLLEITDKSYHPLRKNPVHKSPQQTTSPATETDLRNIPDELQESVKLCRSILKIQPNHPEVNHTMGEIAVRLKQPVVALPYFATALSADPANNKYWLDYIDALMQSDQWENARQQLEFAQLHGLQGEKVDALKIRLAANIQSTEQHTPSLPLPTPQNSRSATDNLTTHTEASPGVQEVNTLVSMFNQGKLTEVATLAKKMTTRFPLYGFGWKMLGAALKELGQTEEAIAHMKQATTLLPDDAEAHNNLGLTLMSAGQLEEAETSYRRALQIRNDYAEAYNNLGILLSDSKRLDEAEASYQHALLIKPDFAEAHSNLGMIFMTTGRLEEAEASCQRALHIKPDFTVALSNLGAIFMDEGKLENAEATYRRALKMKDCLPETYYNLGLALLAQGKYTEAWPYYEQRYNPRTKKPICKIPALACPQWQGESLVGKSLIIWPEQGVGDYIQFVRYASLLKERGVSHLTLFCTPPLKALLETVIGVDTVITELSPATSYDYWSFPLSLPLYFGTTVDSIPPLSPYLHPLTARSERWLDQLPVEKLKVGLVWKGNPEHKNDANRSLPGLSTMASLWSVPGVSFISLQKGVGEDEANHPPAGQPIISLSPDIRDFADTAAIIDQLDLVISIDTSVAHLAGALDKPCWILLPSHRTDWRWLRAREDSPWYPSVRLFRQEKQEDWQAVIERVTEALHLFRDRAASSPNNTNLK